LQQAQLLTKVKSLMALWSFGETESGNRGNESDPLPFVHVNTRGPSPIPSAENLDTANLDDPTCVSSNECDPFSSLLCPNLCRAAPLESDFEATLQHQHCKN
jgi:hypothetical protein